MVPIRSQSFEIALRPKVLRRDKHTPASPERPRKRDGWVGRVAVEGSVYAAHPAEQRQPRRLPAAAAVEPAHPDVPEASTDRVSGIYSEKVWNGGTVALSVTLVEALAIACGNITTAVDQKGRLPQDLP